MLLPNVYKKRISRRIPAHKAWILHSRTSGKISPAPEKSGDISALIRLSRKSFRSSSLVDDECDGFNKLLNH
jgi:hypothetical protein